MQTIFPIATTRRRQQIDSFNSRKRNRKNAYKNGKALQNHIRSAHNGLFNENCIACQEIKQKSNQ